MTGAMDPMRSSDTTRSSGIEAQPAVLSPDSTSLSPRLCNFRRVSCMEDSSYNPFPGLPADILHMRVKEGSKIRNLLRFAIARMQAEGTEGEGTLLRQVIFTGFDRAVTKTITCVEILKRQVQGLHQVSKLHYKTVSEVWKSSQHGVPSITMQRTVPAICILLSKDPLDPQEPGYQPPQTASTPTEDREGWRLLLRPVHNPPSQHTAKRRRVDDSKKCPQFELSNCDFSESNTP